jgi:hypothetical protein
VEFRPDQRSAVGGQRSQGSPPQADQMSEVRDQKSASGSYEPTARRAVRFHGFGVEAAVSAAIRNPSDDSPFTIRQSRRQQRERSRHTSVVCSPWSVVRVKAQHAFTLPNNRSPLTDSSFRERSRAASRRAFAALTADLRPLTSEKRRRSGLAFRDSPYAQ